MNQLDDTSDQLVRAAYGPNYARLVEIKKKYDSNNVPRLNQNIKPDSPRTPSGGQRASLVPNCQVNRNLSTSRLSDIAAASHFALHAACWRRL